MGNWDSPQVFQCPNCQQYISTKYDACRFCSLVLTDEVKAKAVEKEEDGNRQYRYDNYKKVFYVGIGVFAFGAFLLMVSIGSILFTPEGRFFVWSPIITLVGVFQMIGALFGMRDERKKKK